MKKIHTLLLIVGIVAFGAIFAGLNYPTSPPPPPRAKKTEVIQTENISETVQTVHLDFDVGSPILETRAIKFTASEAGFMGSVSVISDKSRQPNKLNEIAANNRRTRILPLLRVVNSLQTNDAHKRLSDKTTVNFAFFRGFGAENRSRAKI